MDTTKLLVSNIFENEIKINVINSIFPILNNSHQGILLKYTVNLVNIIGILFHFDMTRRELYEVQLRQNNYRDLVALVLLLLPYINDDSGDKKKQLTDLNDIYKKKVKNTDITKSEPIYEYSNIQYGRIDRKQIKEIEFDFEHIEHNFKLLIDTIKTVSIRLHVNWIDILPIHLNNYKKTDIYAATVQKYRMKNLDEWENYKTPVLHLDMDIYNKMRGLSINDIYDTISNELFHNIVGIKWLIYDISASDKSKGGFYPLIILLSSILPEINKLICENNAEWDKINNEFKTKFETQWQNFLRTVYNNDNFTQNITIDNENLMKIVRGFLFAFDRGYSNIYDAVKNNEYMPFDENKIYGYDIYDEEDYIIDDDEETKKQKEYLQSSLQQSMNSINIVHVYEFLRETINRLKQTWYARYLFNNIGNIIDIRQYTYVVSDVSKKLLIGYIVVTLKNIYNFAKSLVHDFSGAHTRILFSRHWKSLTESERNIIYDRLNDVDSYLNWFNIQRYILRTYMQADTASLRQQISEAKTKEDKKKIKEIRDTIKKINEWIYEMIQQKLIDIVFESMITRGVLSQFIPNERITNEKHIPKDMRQTLAPLLVPNILNKSGEYWGNAYSYLTNTTYSNMRRMTYTNSITKEVVTTDYFTYNGTNAWYDGYALNWVSQINFFHRYINNRVIYATGATGVGKSTLIPVLLLYAMKAIDYNNNGTAICTEPRTAPTRKNATIIAEQLGVPIDENNKNNYVQYKFKGEDKTKKVEHLVLKVVTDGLLLQELRNPFLKKTLPLKKRIAIKKQNTYDIIILDETHEHNKNMDMVITLLKDYVNINNSVKLVIISATMDDDEPYYRRFFRNINDNRMFPLNTQIAASSIDRINVDRRLHISPPFETTRYAITEYYKPNENPIEIIRNILYNDKTGDILFFQPGIKEIMETINDLNQMLPSEVIALPFYSKLKDYPKQFVENITDNKNSLRIDRSFPFDELTDFNNIGNNHYKQVIIVATNIAEASLTFPTLKYIIDTGKQKNAIFNYKKNGALIVEKQISETSRLQRKGRVGRTSPGTVYYLYNENTTKYIKKEYDISISDIFADLYDRLYLSNNDDILMSKILDPNSYKNIKRNIFSLTTRVQAPRHNVINVTRMLQDQYFTSDGFYSYYGNDKHYDYENYEELNTIYKGGYSFDMLNDNYGKFYFIHPEESQLIRNICGHIIDIQNVDSQEIIIKKSLQNTKYNYIISKKMMSFWITMMDNLMLSISETDVLHSYNITKTDLGQKMIILKQILSEIDIDDVTINYVTTLLYSFSLDVQPQVIKLLSLVISSKGDFFNSIIVGKSVNGRYIKNISGLKKYFGDTSSDIDSMLYLINDIHKMLAANNILIDPTTDEVFNVLAEERGNNRKYINKRYKYGLIAEMANINYIKNNIAEKKHIIIQWAAQRNINPNIILEYINKYIRTLSVIYTIENEMGKSYENPTLTQTSQIIRKSLPYIVEKVKNPEMLNIILCFLNGYKHNIVKHISDNNYLNIYSMNSDSVISIHKTAFYTHLTFTKNISGYLLYLFENHEMNTFNCVIPIYPALIKYIGFVYSNDYVKYRQSESTTLTGYYKHTISEIVHDVITHNDPNIWNKLYDVFTDSAYVETRKFSSLNYQDEPCFVYKLFNF